MTATLKFHRHAPGYYEFRPDGRDLERRWDEDESLRLDRYLIADQQAESRTGSIVRDGWTLTYPGEGVADDWFPTLAAAKVGAQYHYEHAYETPAEARSRRLAEAKQEEAEQRAKREERVRAAVQS